MMSFWLIVNADVFVLSRYLSDTEIGIYTLASRVAFIAAFLPQGFRVALRPLRKAAIYKSVEDQYGRAEQRGQLLGYFVLLCITAVLAMVLAGPVVVDIAPGIVRRRRAADPDHRGGDGLARPAPDREPADDVARADEGDLHLLRRDRGGAVHCRDRAARSRDRRVRGSGRA